MSKKKYTKSKSLYTLRELHSHTDNGLIFENDHVTIIPNDGLFSDDISIFSDSNFKYRISVNDSSNKKHFNSSWIKSDNGNDFWTLDDVTEEISKESKIVLKPNYSSLRDFAYYGSAVELIKATINDIIIRFPGSISFYNENPLSMWDGDKEYYLVSNDYNIDCWTSDYVSPETLKYPMKVLSASYKNYEDSNGQTLNTIPEVSITGSCIGSVIGTTKFAGYELLIYLGENGEKYLVYEKSKHEKYKGKLIIKPKEAIFNEFWESLNDFERVLLNRETNPVYKAEFETPYSNETGFYYKMEQYIWPTVNNDGKTPDITTGRFQSYFQSLISLAEFHDEYDSDNIWRMMTHEAIKNLDWTFTSNGEDVDTIEDIDSSRIKSMVHIQGRLYDDLKRNIDGIKSTNVVSYDEKSNIPDYFLSDILENKGWEAKNIQENKETKANISFARALALSSDYIHSMKGTRRGLETIINMFGYNYTDNYHSSSSTIGDFTIDEYYVEAKGTYPKYCETYKKRVLFDYVNADEIVNFMEGYPVVVVDNGDKNNWYLIPWFNKDAKYKYPLYFQSKGGWGKTYERNINKDITSITSFSGNTLYDETTTYMLFLKNSNELLTLPNSKLRENMICYVEDISNYLKTKNDKDNETGYSHYFILKNVLFSGFFDEVKSGCNGWVNIKSKEFDGSDILTEDGKRVLYHESLIVNEKGNNSHTGKGDYDDGKEYFSYFTKLFGNDEKAGLLNKLTDSEQKEIKEIGFKLSELIKDSKKCYYFGNFLSGTTDNTLNVKTFYNPENPGKRDRNEESANSVINTKHLTIRFKIDGKNEMKQYIKNVVMKYAYEMIPSTSIVEILFDGEESLFKIN